MVKPRARIVPKRFRNVGHSLGLEFPYVFGSLPGGDWCVWHRHTGLVVYVANEALYRPDQHDIFNQRAAQRECYRLNGVSEFPSAEVLAEIDATP